jgi:hypothetical protein
LLGPGSFILPGAFLPDFTARVKCNADHMPEVSGRKGNPVSQLQGARGLETLCVCAVHRPRGDKLPQVQGKRDGSEKVAAPQEPRNSLAKSIRECRTKGVTRRVRDYTERRGLRISSTIFFASVVAGSSRAKGIVVVIRLPPEKICACHFSPSLTGTSS